MVSRRKGYTIHHRRADHPDAIESMVYVSAAVICSQGWTGASHLSIRKVMVLADKSWINSSMYAKMLTTAGRKKHASSFLILATLVNILGALIYPLQQIFSSSQSIKIPTESLSVTKLFDLPDQFGGYSLSNNSGVLATRNSLQSAISQPQAQLWPSRNFSCDPIDCSGEMCSNVLKLANMSTIPDPFSARLPSCPVAQLPNCPIGITPALYDNSLLAVTPRLGSP